MDERERMREEICNITREIRRRLVNTEQWKQGVADGLIPEHLLAAAAELDDAPSWKAG